METKLTKDRFLEMIKSSKKKGQCHVPGCSGSPIKAHSISRSLLRVIAEGGKVVVLRNNMFRVRSPDGSVAEHHEGIGTATTFPGFCSTHDNSLFEPIDNLVFDYSKEQAFLYAYRLLAKEVVRRRQLMTWFPNVKFENISTESEVELRFLRLGFYLGLRSLEEQKKYYDQILSTKEYKTIGYTVFEMKGEPWFLFSGVFAPDFDFQGRLIQDLSDRTSLVQLITFTTVRLDNGWGILFAWEKVSDQSSAHFFNSLRSYMKANAQFTQAFLDAMFRFVLSRTECYAFRGSAWGALSETSRASILDWANRTVKIPLVDSRTDLERGLEGIFEGELTGVRELNPVYE